MKNRIFLPVALAALLSLGACRTTEANYRAAYDVTKAKVVDDGLDDETRAKLRNASERGKTTIYIVGADTLRVKAMFIAREDTAGIVPQFSVAVNGFEQRFNAMAMMNRLKANGFPGAYVCKSAKPLYYVMAAGTDTIGRVPALLEKATREAASLGMGRDGQWPQIIKNAGYRP